MDIVFVAPYVPTSTDTLKLAALYFDRVTIHDRALLDVEPIGDMQHVRKSGIIRRIIPSVDGSLRESIRPLLDEGLIVINSSPSSMLIPPRQRERLRELFGDVKELLFGPAYDSGHEVEVELDESGIAEIHQRLAGPITVGGKFDVGAVYTYYEGLFVEAVGAALRGEPILSCSSILYDMLDRAAEADAVKSLHADRLLGGAVGPRLALDVLSTALVDTGDLDCFDVLEVRYQLRDELVAFRSELERVQFEFTHEFGIEKMLREGHAIAAARHAPRVRELEAKIKSGRVLVLKKLIKSLEKPDAYVPLVGSAFAGVPLGVAIGLSLGILSTRAALEVWDAHREVAHDGLMYLVKLRRRLRQRGAISSDISEPSGPVESSERPRVFLWAEDGKPTSSPNRA